jgi:hypothetical protein
MDDDSLHSLLARGRLSGAQRDRILDRVLDEHAAARPRRRWAIAAGVALPVAAAIALALGLRATATEGDAPGGWLVPKGDGVSIHLEARCPERAAGSCHKGDRLVFSADGVKRNGFFAAHATCGSGERIWYFPAADGTLPSIRAEAGHVVVNQAARIGDEHGTGRCELSLFLLEEPADRAEVLAGSAKIAAKATISLEVLP